MRRETFEEAGIRVGRVRYLASQPWPFPSSMMIGCIGEAETDAITMDAAELEDVRWFTKRRRAADAGGRARGSSSRRTPSPSRTTCCGSGPRARREADPRAGRRRETQGAGSRGIGAKP